MIMKRRLNGGRPDAISTEDLQRFKQAFARPGCATAAMQYYQASVDLVTRHPIPAIARYILCASCLCMLVEHLPGQCISTAAHHHHVKVWPLAHAPAFSLTACLQGNCAADHSPCPGDQRRYRCILSGEHVQQPADGGYNKHLAHHQGLQPLDTARQVCCSHADPGNVDGASQSCHGSTHTHEQTTHFLWGLVQARRGECSNTEVLGRWQACNLTAHSGLLRSLTACRLMSGMHSAVQSRPDARCIVPISLISCQVKLRKLAAISPRDTAGHVCSKAALIHDSPAAGCGSVKA